MRSAHAAVIKIIDSVYLELPTIVGPVEEGLALDGTAG